MYVRILVGLLVTTVLAAACADAPTAPQPDGIHTEPARASGNLILDPVVVIGHPQCDPYLDLNWCQGDDDGDCMSGAPAHTSDADLIPFSGCSAPGSPGGGSLPSPTEPDDNGCNPNTNSDCLQPLSTWDKATIRLAFSRHLRTSFTDASAAQSCDQLASRFNEMMANGTVYRGAFGSTGEPHDPLHVAAYDLVGGTIHFEPDAMAAANAGDPIAVRNILNSALHEAAHSLNYNHTNPVWMGSYDLYSEPPFNLLSPGTNSCITNW